MFLFAFLAVFQGCAFRWWYAILVVMESIARNIFLIALGVVVEALIIFVLRHSWGWLLEQGTDPFLVGAVVLTVPVLFGILLFQIGALRGDVRSLKGDVRSLKGDVRSLKGDVSTLKVDVSALKVDVSALKVDVSSLKGDVKTLRTDVDTLRGDMDVIRVDLDGFKDVFSKFLTIFSASKTVKQDVGLEGSLRAFTAFVGARSNSPLIINEKGREFLVESHLGEFVRQKKDEMFALLDKTGFKTEFLLQKECFKVLDVMLEKPENREWVDKAEKYAYEENEPNIFQYTGVASLLLRDLYFEARGFPPADKSKRPAWEAAQAAVVRDES